MIISAIPFWPAQYAFADDIPIMFTEADRADPLIHSIFNDNYQKLFNEIQNLRINNQDIPDELQNQF